MKRTKITACILSIATIIAACILSIVTIIAACHPNGKATDALHATADSLMNSDPNSALRLLQSHDGEKGLWRSRQRMRHELLRAKAMNKAYVSFTTDSVMRLVTHYYDCNGTPNERMEAHYLLGCTYRDLGEAPRAIDCYLDAVNCADTAQADCDYWQMASIYGQMAKLYHQQLLLSYEKEAHRKASHYNLLAGDTLYAMYHQKMTAGVLILQNERDSAELTLNDVICLYKAYGHEQEAVRTSLMLMHLYADRTERQSDLRRLLDRFESEGGFFDDNHKLPPSMRKYYYYKGRYYENRNALDSAEACYRKMYRQDMSCVEKDPMFSGLLSVFRKRHQTDSIAKYAQLYCEANDSSIALKDQEITAQIASNYNYARYQRLAAYNAEKANKRLIAVILLSLLAGLCIAVLAFFLQRYKTRQTRLRAEYADLIDKYEKETSLLKLLEEKHLQNITILEKELSKAEAESKKASTVIETLGTQYEQEKAKRLDEIDKLKDKIELLERKIDVSSYQEHSMPFFQMGIVRRVRLFAKDRNNKLSESDIDLLYEAATEHFPDLMNDLKCSPGISSLGVQVCLLVTLSLNPKEITHLLDISPSQVGNLKKAVNMALFEDGTARTLYRNLSARYKFFSL